MAGGKGFNPFKLFGNQAFGNFLNLAGGVFDYFQQRDFEKNTLASLNQLINATATDHTDSAQATIADVSAAGLKFGDENLSPNVVGANFQNIMAPIFAELESLPGMAQGQLTNARSLVEGLGDQSRIDINEGAASDASNARAQLQARGLSGTSVVQSSNQNIEIGRRNSIGRLDESIARQQLEVENTFGGRVLETSMNTMLTRAGLLGQGFEAQNQAARDWLENAIRFGTLPADMDLASAQLILQGLEMNTIVAPSPLIPADILPSGST